MREPALTLFGTVSLDGRKLHANASRHSALSYGHAGKIEAQLKAEVQELLVLAEQADQVAAGIRPLIAVKRDEHHPGWRDRFTEPAPLADDASAVDVMKHTLKTKAGRATYALRKQMGGRCSASSNRR